MKRLVVLLAMVMMMLSGCSITASGRQGGQNSETIHVQTCPQATTVGWWAGAVDRTADALRCGWPGDGKVI